MQKLNIYITEKNLEEEVVRHLSARFGDKEFLSVTSGDNLGDWNGDINIAYLWICTLLGILFMENGTYYEVPALNGEKIPLSDPIIVNIETEYERHYCDEYSNGQQMKLFGDKYLDIPKNSVINIPFSHMGIEASLSSEPDSIYFRLLTHFYTVEIHKKVQQ